MEQTTSNAIQQRIYAFLLEKFPLARRQGLKQSDALLESGILDSLGILDLVTFIEAEFSITVADDELVPDNFQTVAHIVTFVESRTAQKA
jgi:acyl carrier protein